MSIKYRCPKCGKDHTDDDATPGQRVACQQCGQAMRIPGVNPGTSGTVDTFSQTISFRCLGCGTSYSTGSNLAGKKVRCKSCGQGIRVPGTADPSTAGSPVARKEGSSVPRPKSPTRQVAPAGPSLEDIYGLEESATVPQSASGSSVSEGRPGSVEEDATLPQRAGAYEPMTAAKKKKLAKRAARVEKARPTFSGAGIGISFGGVLTAALIGWRVYRVTNAFNRPDRGPQMVVGGLGDFGNMPPVDPKAAAAEEDRQVAEMLRAPGTAEAREWLDPAKHPNHSVMEMAPDKAREMVAGFYERGAKRVSVLDPTPLGNTILTAMIAVELPADLAKRRRCFEWETRCLEGDEPTRELGQKYILITTD
jgi:DNA-directed RNA polymerase subunit RPC12/RpoP